MAIRVKEAKIHWNYFLALEDDLARAARFIEPAKPNFRTYSIELAHLLMAASSEVDVVAKLICEQISPKRAARNISDYAKIILPAEPKLKTLTVLVPRFELTLKPWVSWTVARPPLWWSANNRVKHRRNASFRDANLKHCLNALAGLFTMTLYYYGLLHQLVLTVGGQVIKSSNPLTTDSGRRNLAVRLQPAPQLFHLRSLLRDFAERTEGVVR